MAAPPPDVPRRENLICIQVGLTREDRAALHRIAEREGVSLSHLCARVLRRLVDVSEGRPQREWSRHYRTTRWSDGQAVR